MSSPHKSITLASVAVLSWSTVATSFKIAQRELTVYEMVLIAALTALGVFAVWLTVRGKWRSLGLLSPRTWLSFALLGLVNPVIYYLTLFRAYALLPAQIAQPINYIWPILLLVLLAVFTGVPIQPRKYIGMAISLGGLTLISYGGNAINGSISVLGIVWALLSALLWGIYWMMNDRLKDKADEDVSLFIGFLFGTIYLLAGVAAATLFAPAGTDEIWGIPTLQSLSFNTAGILSGMYIGLFEMGIPFLCFGMAIRMTTNPALINQMCYLAPFLSLFFISMILGEPIVATTYTGLILIIAGIAYNEYFAGRRKRHKIRPQVK